MKNIFVILAIVFAFHSVQVLAIETIAPGSRDVNMENVKRNFDEMRVMLCTSEIFILSAGQTSAVCLIPWIAETDKAIAAIKEPASIANVSRNISVTTPAQNITVPAQNITFTVGTESVTITVPAQTVSVPSQTFNQGVTFPAAVKRVTCGAGSVTVELTEAAPVNMTGEILIHKKIVEKRY